MAQTEVALKSSFGRLVEQGSFAPELQPLPSMDSEQALEKRGRGDFGRSEDGELLGQDN
jgi:hypothetical protein